MAYAYVHVKVPLPLTLGVGDWPVVACSFLHNEKWYSTVIFIALINPLFGSEEEQDDAEEQEQQQQQQQQQQHLILWHKLFYIPTSDWIGCNALPNQSVNRSAYCLYYTTWSCLVAVRQSQATQKHGH